MKLGEHMSALVLEADAGASHMAFLLLCNVITETGDWGFCYCSTLKTD